MLETLQEGIYRVCIPFENIYTSAFILADGKDSIILDSGSSDLDAEKYIIPEVKKLNITPKYLVSSHNHSDHYGGINALKREYPYAREVSFSINNIKDNQLLFNRYRLLNLKGHSDDSLAIFDLKTNILFSCDCLQMYGVDKYRTGVNDRDKYLRTIERVRMLNPTCIIASHEYEPLGSKVNGKDVEKLLQLCVEAIG